MLLRYESNSNNAAADSADYGFVLESEADLIFLVRKMARILKNEEE